MTKVARVLVVLVLLVVGPALFRSVGLPLLNDRLSLAAEEQQGPVVRGRKDKDDDKKSEGNAEKQSEQDGNPRNRDKPPRRQNSQSERAVETNDLGSDAFQIEGLVLSTLCKRNPKEVVIGTIDGNVTLRLHPRRFRDGSEWEGEVRCDDLVPGDYIYVHESLKVNEHLYDVYEIRCQQDNTGSGDENDNGDVSIDEEDSCPHLPPPPGLDGRSWPSVSGSVVAAHSVSSPVLPSLKIQPSESMGLPLRQEADDNDNNGANDELPPDDNDNDGGDDELPPGWKLVVVEPGEAAVLTSDDGRVAISVREGHAMEYLTLLYGDVDPLPYPPPPGPNVGALFTLQAFGEDGGELDDLPIGVNVGVRCTSYYVQGIDMTRLTLGVLETDAGGWIDVSSVPDPDARYVSATITRTGVYAAYERPTR